MSCTSTDFRVFLHLFQQPSSGVSFLPCLTFGILCIYVGLGQIASSARLPSLVIVTYSYSISLWEEDWSLQAGISPGRRPRPCPEIWLQELSPWASQRRAWEALTRKPQSILWCTQWSLYGVWHWAKKSLDASVSSVSKSLQCAAWSCAFVYWCIAKDS